MDIHKSADISPKAELGKGVTIGPFVVIEDNVIIGDGTRISSSALLASGTRVGKNCKIFHSAVLGTIPQDLKFKGEITTLEIGDNTTIREFATLNRGTEENWKTVIGNNCLIMTYAHIAHDCILGNNVVIANSVNMAGHVIIEDFVGIGGLTPIHQFVHIGQHSFIGGGLRVSKDVPPYVLAIGDPMRYGGLNRVGLIRRGFTEDKLELIKNAYKILYKSNHRTEEALQLINNELEPTEEIHHIVEFIKKSERGIIR